MNEIRVLLADASVDFVRSIEGGIRLSPDMSLAGTVNDGALVFEAVLQTAPDVLLLELMLPNCDGVTVVRDICDAHASGALEHMPLIIVISAIINDANTYLLRKAGIDYYIVKPVTPRCVIERVRDLWRNCRPTDIDAAKSSSEQGVVPLIDEIDRDITTLLIDLGIPASLSGYTYLREAIRLVVSDDVRPERMLSKRIYPEIAKRHGKSVAGVEKAIRTAIETAWIRGRADNLDRLFGYTVSAQRGKPTNTEFIAMIADRYKIFGRVHLLS